MQRLISIKLIVVLAFLVLIPSQAFAETRYETKQRFISENAGKLLSIVRWDQNPSIDEHGNEYQNRYVWYVAHSIGTTLDVVTENGNKVLKVSSGNIRYYSYNYYNGHYGYSGISAVGWTLPNYKTSTISQWPVLLSTMTPDDIPSEEDMEIVQPPNEIIMQNQTDLLNPIHLVFKQKYKFSEGGYRAVEVVVNNERVHYITPVDYQIIVFWENYKHRITQGLNTIQVFATTPNDTIDTFNFEINYQPLNEDRNLYITPQERLGYNENITIHSYGFDEIQMYINNEYVGNRTNIQTYEKDYTRFPLKDIQTLLKNHQHNTVVIKGLVDSELIEEVTYNVYYAPNEYPTTDPNAGGVIIDKPNTPIAPESGWDIIGWLQYFAEWILYVVNSIGYFFSVIASSIEQIFNEGQGAIEAITKIFNGMPAIITTIMALGLSLMFVVGVLRR